MKKNEKTADYLKKEYLSPSVTMDLIEMEYGIATNSVITQPESKPGEQTEWENEDNQTIYID